MHEPGLPLPLLTQELLHPLLLPDQIFGFRVVGPAHALAALKYIDASPLPSIPSPASSTTGAINSAPPLRFLANRPFIPLRRLFSSRRPLLAGVEHAEAAELLVLVVRTALGSAMVDTDGPDGVVVPLV